MFILLYASLVNVYFFYFIIKQLPQKTLLIYTINIYSAFIDFLKVLFLIVVFSLLLNLLKNFTN